MDTVHTLRACLAHQNRKLRIVKPPLPALGICEHCKSQFKSGKVSQAEAEKEIQVAFDAHTCKLIDAQQK